ncbi:amidase [Pelomonas sp. Root1217]|uniref:amidase n=1 Tax=Pelomonas sp. Root1217 TaxID=1736430 RepID=UPI000ACD9B58|nr:amidase [Pelomonas sp. Root1217]
MFKKSLLGAIISMGLAACGGSPGIPNVDLCNGDPKCSSPASSDIDVAALSIDEIRAGYITGRFTSEEVTRAYLRRIEAYDPSYNAFTTLSSDALVQARAIDQRRARGEVLGPLAGVPVVVKESMDVRGMPSTAGWAAMSKRKGGMDFFPIDHAVVVQRLVDAGAIIIGKTNIPAFSDDGTRANTSWAGPTYNAIDRNLAPGASSSGTATAVAAGFATAGLAEETGGSIQNPSAAQSLVGIKPTFALVPTAGVVPLAGSTRDVVGPIAQSVRDAALVLDALAGYSARDPKTSASDSHIPAQGYTSLLNVQALKGKRIGLYGPGWNTANLSPETEALYRKAIQELMARGATVVTDPFERSGFAELALAGEPYDYRGTESAAYDLNNYLKGLGVPSLAALKNQVHASPFDAGGTLSWYVDALPTLKASLAQPDQAPPLEPFFALRARYLQVFNGVMAAQQLDAMVVPQALESLPALFSDKVIAETSISALDVAGLPGVTVPAGQYANKAPFSLLFVGRAWDEASLLALAYDYEQATKHRVKPTLLAK